MLIEHRERVYKLMDEDKKGFFHSYRGDGYLPLSMREVIENITHEFDGKIFYHSYAKNSLRMTYMFNDKFANYLFRSELIKSKIPYMTTGYPESTYLNFDI